MSRKKNSDEQNVKPSTKEEIEAAVNACYGNPKEKITLPDIPGIPTEEEVFSECNTPLDEEQKANEKCKCNDFEKECHCENCKCDDDKEDKSCDCGQGMDTSKDKFFSDCHDLNIFAKDCRFWSDKSSDPSI